MVRKCIHSIYVCVLNAICVHTHLTNEIIWGLTTKVESAEQPLMVT